MKPLNDLSQKELHVEVILRRIDTTNLNRYDKSILIAAIENNRISKIHKMPSNNKNNESLIYGYIYPRE